MMITKLIKKIVLLAALVMVAAAAFAHAGDYSQLAKSAGLTQEQAAGMTLNEIAEANASTTGT